MKTTLLLLMTILLTACDVPQRRADHDAAVASDADDYPEGAFAPARARAITGFAGIYNHGRLYLEVMIDGQVMQAATDMPLGTQSSGPSGSTTPAPNAALLHQTTTVSAATRDGACNAPPFGDTGVPAPFLGVCTTIQMISGFSQYVLNPYVQLVSLSPCGTTTSVTTFVKDASSSTIGVDNSLGLWGYTQPGGFALLYPAGDAMGRDRASRNWFFATDQSGITACFRFVAVAMGQPWSP